MPEPAAVDLLVSGGLVVTVDPAWSLFADGAVAIRDGVLVAIGPRSELVTTYQAERTIDARGRLVIPGLINTHTHAPMVIYRGLADDLPLMTWLEDFVWPAEARFTTADAVRAGATLAAAEMIAGGTTCFADMYFFPDVAAEATRAAGLRGVIGRTFLNFPAPDAPGPAHALADCERFLERWHGDPLITPAVAPHSIYAVDPRWLTAGHELAVRYRVPFHTHVSETAGEVDTCRSANKGLTPPAFLDALGVLDERTVAAHCVHVTAQDIALLAARGAGVAHCPESNMKLASGVAPIPDMLAGLVKVGLGSDGAMSNNNLSMLGTMNMAALLHKVVREDPTVVPARTVVHMATQGGADVLGLGDRLGSLEPGKVADVVLLRLDRPHAVPLYDPYSHLAYVLQDGDVDTVIIAGQVVYEGGELRTIDLPAVRDAVQEIAGRIAAAEIGRHG